MLYASATEYRGKDERIVGVVVANFDLMNVRSPQELLPQIVAAAIKAQPERDRDRFKAVAILDSIANPMRSETIVYVHLQPIEREPALQKPLVAALNAAMNPAPLLGEGKTRMIDLLE